MTLSEFKPRCNTGEDIHLTKSSADAEIMEVTRARRNRLPRRGDGAAGRNVRNLLVVAVRGGRDLRQ